MSKSFLKSLVALTLLMGLIVAAIPALASSARPQRLAPGWTPIFPAVSPPPRASHAMAYDTVRKVAVLFGGYGTGGVVLDDIWEWDSQTMTWTERQPEHRPPGVYGHAMVYDEARGVVVLFGGNVYGPGYTNASWEYNGSDWTEVVTASAPEARWLHAMAYDPDRQVTVLHSGQTGLTRFGDTWEYNGVDWVEQDIVNPPWPYRSGEGMAYDRQRQVMTLFGGVDDGVGTYNETYERADGGDWLHVFPLQSPTPRYRFGFVYYGRARSPFLFGGEPDFYDDVAIYDGQTWRTKPFNPRPSGRCCLAMVYDSMRKAVFLFGGSEGGTEQNDSWYFR